MKVWIVTGGAATGKSAFCEAVVRACGDDLVCHFSCDQAANDLWSDPETERRIVDAFGSRFQVVSDDGVVDRGRIRKVVFSNPDMRERLESILHPSILQMMENARVIAEKAAQAKVFLAEVPLYYEIRTSLPADMVIVVAATRTIQKTRLMEHRHLDADTCEGLLKAQLPLELKTNKADVVVWNDGLPAVLEAQVLALLRDRWEP